MIDDEAVENAAFEYGEGIGFEAFIDGAKWGVNKFLKDLWHSANEIPEIGRIFIMENHYCDGRIELYSCIRCETFHNALAPTTQKWFYLDDLLLKKEVSND